MTPSFLIGLIGAFTLVAGAAYPPGENAARPMRSVKNWLFAIGGFLMLAYSTLNYMAGGVIFFVILQIFINSTSVLMMLNVRDAVDIPVITTVGTAMVAWSLYLFEGMNTAIFVLGLSVLGLGYALEMGTVRRNVCLAVGSGAVCLFSYIAGDMIFFWLNLFFALFSGYYAIRLLQRNTDPVGPVLR